MDLKLSPFSIKDLMLGEILCQAFVISDHQFLEATQAAKRFGITFGAALVRLGIMGSHELFHARRMLSLYLREPDKLDEILITMRDISNRTAVQQRMTA